MASKHILKDLQKDPHTSCSARPVRDKDNKNHHYKNQLVTGILQLLTSPKLFISSKSKNTTDESLFNAFAQYGRLFDAKVIMDRWSGKPRRFGFITYETLEEAEKAREEMNSKHLDGWVIFVHPARPREPPPPPRQPPQQDLHLNPKPIESLFETNRTLGWFG